MLCAELAAAPHERHRGAHEIHVAGDRLDHHTGQLRPVQREGLFQLRDVVVFEHQRVLHDFRRHAGAGRVAKRRQAGTGLDQQRIGVAVVTALEFDELAAAGGTAGEPDRTHRGLGARTDQPDHLQRRHPTDDLLGQFNFTFGRCAKRKPVQRRLLHGFQHRRVAVAQDHRAPGADVVDVALVVCVPEIGAMRAFHKARRAAHGPEGAHRRVDPAGDDLAGALEQVHVGISVWFH